MNRLEVFDPPMCCSTGICGPAVDPTLARFAADLGWLKAHGVEVVRFNLSRDLSAFAGNVIVKQALVECGNECLPLVLRKGRVVSKGRYPTRDELGSACELDISTPPGSESST